MDLLNSASRTATILENSSLRVMIVDDHELLRNGLRDLLNSIQGFTVVEEASSCQGALAKVETTPLDLVLLDLFLPDGDAIPLIRQIRQRNSPPSVIILSATVSDDYLLDAMLAGASGYLTKDMT